MRMVVRMRAAAAGALAVCAALVLAGQLPVGAAGAWLSAIGIAGTVPAWILMGIAGAGSRARRRAVLVIVMLGVVLTVSCVGMVAVSGHGPGWTGWGGGVGGVSVGAGVGLAFLLGGVWLMSLVVVALGHAWSFDGDGRRRHPNAR